MMTEKYASEFIFKNRELITNNYIEFSKLKTSKIV